MCKRALLANHRYFLGYHLGYVYDMDTVALEHPNLMSEIHCLWQRSCHISSFSLYALAQWPQYIRSVLNYYYGQGDYLLFSEQFSAAICVTEKNESVTHLMRLWISCVSLRQMLHWYSNKEKASVLSALQCHSLSKLSRLRKSLERAE